MNQDQGRAENNYHETALALVDAPRSLRNYVSALQAENERLRALLESAVFARDIAMKMTMKADIPYCAEFSAIAQELDAAIANATTAV